METKYKPSGCMVKVLDQDQGIVEAIVNVFTIVDRTGERTIPGLFAESLKRGLPKGVWHHDWAKPICKTLEALELLPGDERLPESIKHLGGLYVKMQFFKDIEDSWQAFLKIKNGLIDEFSIGYSISKSAWDADTQIRDLLEGDWYEYSPVLVGANQATELISAKGQAPVTISGVWLRYFDSKAAVLVEVDGKWVKCITATIGDPEEVVSHICEPNGIRQAPVEKDANPAQFRTKRTVSNGGPDESAIITKFLEGLHEATLEDHSTTVLDAVAGFISRYKRLAQKKEADGQTFSEAHIERLDAHSAALAELRLLGKATEADPGLKSKLLRLQLDHLKRRSGAIK